MLHQTRSAGPEVGGPGEPVCVRHESPGRLRLGIAGLKNSPELSDLLFVGIGEINGVKNVRPSTLTGNVVILFDPEAISCPTLLRVARALLSGALTPGGAGPGGAAWHTMSVQAVAQGLMTSVQTGLTHRAARDRLAQTGRNVLIPPHVRSSAHILAAQFKSFPVAVLAGATLISVITGALLEAAAISAVVVLNAAIGYVSEARAERILSSLETERSPIARLLRDGQTREQPAEMVVPGDVIMLQRGDVVPADARVIQAAGLSVSESALTGESLPVSKTVEPLPDPGRALAERTNMVYRGTIVTGGSGAAIVVATGARTEVGRVQQLVARSRPPETAMQSELDQLGGQLVWITGAASALLVLMGVLRGQNLFLLLRSALTVAVAAIPEGLPMIATTALSVGVERMRKRGMIVRHINAIETLASVDVVCFDKTGTLTLNQMAVAELASGSRRVAGRELGSSLRRDNLGSDMRRMLEVCCLCSEVELDTNERGELVIEGSATEMALVRAAMAAGLDPRQVRARSPLVRIQHRSEAYRFMATLHHVPAGSLLAVKGDPVEVISRCTRVLGPDGRVRYLSPEDREAIQQINREMAGRALRVLGFAYDELVGRPEVIAAEGLTWVGLAGLSDPVRPGVGDVVKRLEKAGVRSIMVTGDAPATARAVAAEIGLTNGRDLRVMTADELKQLDEAERARIAKMVDVFARVSPAEKLEIVRALQSSGAVVAMLGDGINDSPALRAADVGLAVGRNGDSAAREVADIFLENEDLSLILTGIEQGRATQASVRRALRFLLGTNSSEVMLVLAGTAIFGREVLSPAQLLWINLVTDVLPGIALALEPQAPGLIERKPEQRGAPILGARQIPRFVGDGALLASSSLIAGLFGSVLYGRSAPQVQRMIFESLVEAQLVHALNCRTQPATTRALDLVVYGTLALQEIASVLPVTRHLLGLAPVGPLAMGIMAGSAGLSYLAIGRTREPEVSARRSPLHFVRKHEAARMN
jgi:Ca2+-transporting ATPase